MPKYLDLLLMTIDNDRLNVLNKNYEFCGFIALL